MNNHKSKILFVSLFPPKSGGLALQSKILADHLRDEGLDIVRINVHQEIETHSIRGKIFKALVQPLSLLRRLIKSIRKVNLVHVAACSYWGFMPLVIVMPVCKLYNRSMSVTYHGGYAAEFMKKHHRWAAPILRQADFIIVPSHFLKEIFGRYELPCRVAPVIGDFHNFELIKRKKMAPIFVSNRHLEPLYDVGTTLRAFRKIQLVCPSAHLIIAGTGSQQQQLKDYATSNNLQVDFRGEIPFNDMPALLNEADIYINSAKTDNMPMSVLEAIYSGLLVISTPVGELTNLIRHGNNGLFFFPGDDESLAKTILFALKNQKLSLNCSYNARSIALNCTWPQLRDNYLELFQLKNRVELNHVAAMGVKCTT